MPPSITSSPTWFQVPSPIAPAFATNTLVNQNQQVAPLGPYYYGESLFWVQTDYPYRGSGNTSHLSIYQSVDHCATQPYVRIPSTFTPLSGSSYFSSFWDGSSKFIYIAWIDVTITGGSRKLLTATFDMDALAWSTVNDTGISISFSGHSVVQISIVVTPNGNITVLWDDGVSIQSFAVYFNGASWGAKVNGPMQVLLGAVAISGNLVGVFTGLWDFSGSYNPAAMSYLTFDGVAFTVRATTTVANFIMPFPPFTAIYDSAHDVVAIQVADNPNNQGNAQHLVVYSVTPSASGASITATVVDTDIPEANGWEEAFLIANSTFTKFYLIVNQAFPLDADWQLLIYTASSLTGPWSSKSVFFDANLHNTASPPSILTGEAAPLIIPFYATVSPVDGRIGVGMALQDVDNNAILAGALSALTSIAIACPVSAGSAQVGAHYSAFLIVIGGTAPFAFVILSGSLPPGLTLNEATGEISGIPTANGTFNYVAQVTDANGNTAHT